MKGLAERGEKNLNASLTEEEVREIRLDPRTAPEVAEERSVSPSTIRAIRRGDSWSHVPMPPNMPSWPKGKAGQKGYRK